MLAGARSGHAQTTGSLDGTVRDNAGSLVPKASLTLTNEKSGSVRRTRSNGHGDFIINAIPPDTYSLDVSAPGFETYRVSGIDIHPGDQKTVALIQLKVGAEAVTVTVTADAAGVSLDSPEKSALLTADDIKRLSTVGRDATELIRTLPGFAVSSGLDNSATDKNSQTMGFGTSSVSNFSANGSTPQTGATTVVSDGANVMDAGDMGASTQNINMDMVQEIKVQTSNFGADSAKGPVVINAIGKSGGSTFHGTAYLFARNGVLNANDWYSNNQLVARPPTSYLYPGGNIGGPVIIPGTGFNHNKKLHFFTGFEFYKQTLFQGLLQAFIPTAQMLKGDLTPATIASALNVDVATLTATCPNFYTTNGVSGGPTLNGSGGICYSPGLAGGPTYTEQDQIISGGHVPASTTGFLQVDPNALAYAKFWPKTNRTPMPNPQLNLLSDGYNYENSLTSSDNGFQYQGRIDDDITDTLKLNVTYKLETNNYEQPLTNSFYAGSDTIPYPTSEFSHTKSNGVNVGITKTVGATLTNEVVVAGVLFSSPAQFANPALVQDTNTGWTRGRFYNNGALQLPGLIDYENGTPDFAMAYDPLGTGKYLHKFSYSAADNVTKQLGPHTFKGGVYFENTGNNQLPYNYTQGLNAFNHYNNGCTTVSGAHTSQLQNNIANFLQGCTQFSQSSASPPTNLRYRQLDFYVQDEWKTTPKLTLTLAIRFQHTGAWYSPNGLGLAVWNAPAQHVLSAVTQDPHTYPGISWHQTNAAVPLSGQPTRPLFYSPRVGLSYDVYGKGTTVVRGGFGFYRFHDSYNDSAGALATTLGVQNYTTPNNVNCTYDQISQSSAGNKAPGAACVFTSGLIASQAPFDLYALDPRDDRQPVTLNWNFTVDQQMPFGGLLEMSYVGNTSNNLFTAGNLRDQNYIPLGGLFQPDPLTGSVTVAGSSQQVQADYRPYPNYGHVFVPSHIAYDNYHSLQASYNKRKGAFIYGFNYTWSKALGIHGDYRNGISSDPSNLENNYGYLGFNRTHIFNATYSWQTGNLYKGNAILRGLINQWEISGITNLQSGPDVAVLTGNGSNFTLSTALGYTPPGGTSVQVNSGNAAFLGTPDIPLEPVVTCDPSANLRYNPKLGRQYINGACFGLPAFGSNGTFKLPDVHGPAYFQTDLTLQRTIQLHEKQNLQFRLAGFNVLNHPLPAFVGNNIGLGLTFAPPPGFTATSAQQAYANAVENSSNFGYTPNKQGFRIIELGARYNF